MQLIDVNRQRRSQRVYHNIIKNIELKNKLLLFNDDQHEIYFKNNQYYNDELYNETFQKIIYNIILVEIEQNINKKNNNDNLNDNQNTTNIIFVEKILIIFNYKFCNEKFISNNKLH